MYASRDWTSARLQPGHPAVLHVTRSTGPSNGLNKKQKLGGRSEFRFREITMRQLNNLLAFSSLLCILLKNTCAYIFIRLKALQGRATGATLIAPR